jgi:Ca-activated chloride channel family protein
MYGLCAIIDGDQVPFIIQKVEVTGVIVDQEVEYVVQQRYVNPWSDYVDTVFSWPIFPTVAITDFKASYKGVELIGELKRKEEAKEMFEEAQKKGQFAAMVEETLGDVLTISLGRVSAKEEVSVSLRCIVQITDEKFVLPTYIAPRYQIDRSDETRPIQNPYADRNDILYLSLTSLVDLQTVESPTHEITIRDGIISFRGGRVPLLQQDFVLLIPSPGGNRVWQQAFPEANETFLFASIHELPTLESPKKGERSSSMGEGMDEYDLVVDLSGSMEDGDKMKFLRRLLHLALKSLPPNILLNVWRFGSNYDKLWTKPKVLDTKTIEEVKRAIDEMEPNYGGTEMQKVIEAVYQLPLKNSRTIILLTDGQIDAEREIASYLQNVQSRRQKDVDIRLYVIGIGDQPSRSTIGKLSEYGGGVGFVVLDNQDLNSIVVKVLQMAREPRIVDVHFRLEEGPERKGGRDENDTCRELNLTNGSISIWRRYSQMLSLGKVTIYLLWSNGEERFLTLVPQQITDQKSIHLNQIWAKCLIAKLDIAGGSHEAMIQASLRYHVLSPQTALIAVDKRTQKPLVLKPASPSRRPEVYKSLRAFSSATYHKRGSSGKVGAPVMGAATAPTGSLEAKESKPVDTEEDKLFDQIVRLQKLDGSFPFSSLITKIEKEIQAFRDELLTFYKKTDKEWPTVLVLTFLYQKLKARKREWQLLAEKAEDFLEQKCGDCYQKWKSTFGK